ncbi:YraN family protein [bacterium]|nr:YraN family protein [bacterium]
MQFSLENPTRRSQPERSDRRIFVFRKRFRRAFVAEQSRVNDHSSKSQRAGFLRRLFGDRGENEAAKFLKRKGYRILAKQFETRWGELDLICLDGDCIVFVEVKTRRSAATTQPGEAVDARKQAHLTKAAFYWLKQNNLLEHRARFDIVAIVWPDESKQPQIEHFENAFESTDFGQMF